MRLVIVTGMSGAGKSQALKIFEDFGGVYMTRCTWNVSARIWNYEVIIYVK